MEIGAQLYTVRDFCKTTDDFAETLRRIADIGYRTVQVSGTCAFEPEWLRDRLAESGLRCVLTHTPTAQLLGDAAKVAHDHDVFGCRYVGLGYAAFDAGQEEKAFKQMVSDYLPVAHTLAQNGKYFMYHNHDSEFRHIGGKTVMECLADSFSADEMGFTVDTFWVQAGGGNPAEWIEKLAGRVPCIHLKDYLPGKVMMPVGEGNINFDRVFEAAENAVCEYLLVEQDNCNGEDPFSCLKRSYEYLRACGLN